jgi:hypothetical protein
MSDNLAVYTAINEITLELSKEGIAKERTNQAQHYQFRGVDDVYEALAGKLAEHKLCIIPRVLSREHVEKTMKSGAVMFYSFVDVAYDFVSAIDGSKHTAVMAGEASDSGDKSCKKALSAAYSYMCFETFCIPTQGDNDSENDKEETTIAKPVVPLNIDTTTVAHERLRNLLALQHGEDEAKIKDTLVKITAYTGTRGDYHAGVDSLDKITTALAGLAVRNLEALMKPKEQLVMPDTSPEVPTKESLLAWLAEQTDPKAIAGKTDYLDKVNALTSVADKKELMIALARKRAELGAK